MIQFNKATTKYIKDLEDTLKKAKKKAMKLCNHYSMI